MEKQKFKNANDETKADYKRMSPRDLNWNSYISRVHVELTPLQMVREKSKHKKTLLENIVNIIRSDGPLLFLRSK